jgi:hypothetical protein
VKRVEGGETYKVCTACGKETEPPDHSGQPARVRDYDKARTRATPATEATEAGMTGLRSFHLPSYRLHDNTGDDLGTIEHAAGNLEPGDIVFLPDGREALVTARVEAVASPCAALLEVVVAPSPLDADDALP